MEYRELGRTGLRVSTIGLGTEFLFEESPETVKTVIGEAIAQGINYFDILWAKPEFRDKVAAGFRGNRHRVNLSAHLGCVCQPDGQYYVSRDPAVCENFIDDYLRRFATDVIDVLFLHNCNTDYDYERLTVPHGLLELAHRLQQQGKARFIGFSSHNAAVARRAVESGQIDVLMYPVNLACHAVPGFQELLDACLAHRVGLVAMKPFGGGSLLRQTYTIEVDEFQMGRMETSGAPTRFKTSTVITAVQCLAYVLGQPSVSTTVPGCKNIAELEAALAYWCSSPAERDLSRIMPDFAEYPRGQCVYCNHCLPCPVGIDIGKIASLVDQAEVELTTELLTAYKALPIKASECLSCGDCEGRCPFDVEIVAKLEKAVALFEN